MKMLNDYAVDKMSMLTHTDANAKTLPSGSIAISTARFR
jgi:hypothetical protein